MRFLRPFLLSLSVVSSYAYAQDLDSDSVLKQKHAYQSDVARLRRIVINRDVFLRELISNANDALEKLRLISLTVKQVWNGSEPLNISIKAVKDEDGPGGRIIISDTGIGMSPEELTANLGTLAKSGTAEFLQRAESTDGTNSGNLIGAFGLGFYSSFLVANRYEDEVPVEDEESLTLEDTKTEKETPEDKDEDEAVIEEVSDDETDTTKEKEEETKKATFRDFTLPLAWQYFSGDTGSGVSFKAIIFVPSRLDDKFWSEPLNIPTKDIRLLVKRVKVIIDAEDLPLNASRESLQHTKFLKQIKQIIVKRVFQLLTKIADEDPETFEKIWQAYGPVIKLDAVESAPNREKLAALARSRTTQRDSASLDQYLENRKKGQKQIFYLTKVGKPIDTLKPILVHRSCGSTVGPMLSKIGVRTVDVGNAMLSMHSIRETAGSHDVQHAIDLFSSLFEGFATLDKTLSLE
ncbi:ribosomal protein S5 domain 2-like protein [Fomitiporia mediterranea MF3/22]|uniref:ribosomal protein S5 domain 2-like protein n=1 Tax=Fomitiporia mediterranea (strain MF3/22) TaxID=694068 RepID=UPI0004408A04|nr:ribosomal protein S5 domain 2-like protein [Fomitiporia mediterranea MF3/22]EJD01373.1 ribosomal protein S5 domain 2-like protein [Fomitiporia mediterranea MF3/22]